MSAPAPHTTLLCSASACVCTCAMPSPFLTFSRLSPQPWLSWLSLPSVGTHSMPCTCLFSASGIHYQPLHTVCKGSGPEVALKFIFSKPPEIKTKEPELSYPCLVHCDLDVSRPTLVHFLVGKPSWDAFYDICS